MNFLSSKVSAVIATAAAACCIAATPMVALADDRDGLFIIDVDDLSLDLNSYQQQGVQGLDFYGALPVPQETKIATRVNFGFDDDGLETTSITTQASATYVITPQIATRVNYITRLGSDGSDSNHLRVEAAMTTNCAGQFDVVGDLNADSGEAKFKSLTWHLPSWGGC